MKRLGIYLLVFGVGSFILPFFGLQFRLLNLFGDYTPIMGIVLAVVGLALMLIPAGAPKEQVTK